MVRNRHAARSVAALIRNDVARWGAIIREAGSARSDSAGSERMSVDALADIQVEDIEYLRHPSGPLLARIYRPKGRPRAALVSLHGGRWTRETRLTNAVIDEALARDGALVMALDIRMPPVGALSRLPRRHQLSRSAGSSSLCAQAGRASRAASAASAPPAAAIR